MAGSDVQRWFFSLGKSQQRRCLDCWASGQPVHDLIHTLPPGHRPGDDDPWVLMTQGIWETADPSRPEYQMSQPLDDFLAAEHDRRMNPRTDQ